MLESAAKSNLYSSKMNDCSKDFTKSETTESEDIFGNSICGFLKPMAGVVKTYSTLSVTDNDGNKKTYYEDQVGNYIVVSRDAEGGLISIEVKSREEALKDIIKTSSGNIESMNLNTKKNSDKTINSADLTEKKSADFQTCFKCCA